MVIGVIGIGTAGLQSIAYMLGHLPSDIKIVSIHDPKINILGIGESTTTFLPYVLSVAYDFSLLEDGDSLDATVKHGVKYSNWSDNDFFTNILPPYHGIHFNNFKLREYVLSKSKECYADRFLEIQGQITETIQTDDNVCITVDGKIHTFDYLIDCTGYPKDYSNYVVDDNMPVNHCLVHMEEMPGDWNFTHHYATNNGWMFGIPLTSRQGWGYLYNDSLTSKDEATQDIAKIFNKDVTSLQLREFKFKNYHAKTFIDRRIAVNGNKALFYEPMEALSGTFYEAILVEFIKVILDGKSVTDANMHLTHSAEVYKDFISFVYSGGSIYDSVFWKETTSKVGQRLSNSDTFKDTTNRINFLSDYGDERIVMFPVSIDLWKHIEEKMKLGYFND